MSQGVGITQLTLGALREQSKELGRDRFLKRYPEPVLVLTSTTAGGPDADTGFRTLDDPDGSTATPSSVRMSQESLVWPVRKVQATFPDKVSIGRSSNNDITVRDPNVSKLHAYIVISGGRQQIVDADSRNGTYVDGRRLEAMDPQVIEDGAMVQIGPMVRAMYCTPDSLWTLLDSGLVS